MNKNDTMLPDRIKLILDWLLINEELVLYSDAVKIEFDVKGMSVKGRITVLPDAKK